MLGANSVTYSSLPQEEGMMPRSSFTGAPRPNPTNHNRRDFQLAAIITAIVIATGLTLAATLPFVLKGHQSENDKSSQDYDDNDDDIWSDHLNVGDDNTMTIDDWGHVIDEEDDYTDDYNFVTPPGVKEPSVDVDVVATTKTPIVPEIVPVPVRVTTPQTIVVETDPPFVEPATSLGEVEAPTETKTEDGEGGNSPPEGGNETPEEEGGGDDDDDDGDIDAINIPATEIPQESGEQLVTSSGVDSNDVPPSHESDKGKDDDIDLNQLLNEIYGEEGSAKPSKLNNNSWTTDMLSTKDKWTIVVLAAVVAIALAAVIVSVAWLVHSRIASRRRRLNIQNVITDLQTRDKVVLLNSEESEEE